MCIHMYKYVCTYIQIYIHTYTPLLIDTYHYTYAHVHIYIYTYRRNVHIHTYAYIWNIHMRICTCSYTHTGTHTRIHLHVHIQEYMGVARNGGLSRFPSSVTNLCRGLSATNPCCGPLCTAAVFNRLIAGSDCRKTLDSVTSLVAKRPPGPATSPMFLGRCHIHVYIYIYTHAHIPICTHTLVCTCEYTYVHTCRICDMYLEGKGATLLVIAILAPKIDLRGASLPGTGTTWIEARHLLPHS